MNWFLDRIRSFRKPPEVVAEIKAEAALEQRRMVISEHVRNQLNEMGAAREAQKHAIKPMRLEFDVMPYTPPKGVAPASHVLAMDRRLATSGYDISSIFTGSGFPGFSYLTELTQLTEYRDMSERIASEMTRKWIKFTSGDEKDRADKLKEIEAEFKRLGVSAMFRRAAELDGQMGRAQIFIDMGKDEGDELSKPLLLDPMKIKKGTLHALRIVEPINTYPFTYNSTNPLSEDFYKPSIWYVQSQPVHASRLLTFVSRPLPNLLKPAYNFSGMSISQLAQPFVDYWFDTRDSVGNALKNFSTSILQTNMASVLTGGGAEVLMTRAKMFNKLRDNQGLFIMDKNTEGFQQVNTPLGGLSQLQAQAQEHMASVAKTPLVVLLGVSPTGLNASSDGEIRVFYDYVADCQEKLFRPNLDVVLKLVQMNLWGQVYDDIGYEFVGLYTMTAKDHAMIRASDAEAGAKYITNGVIDSVEERTRLAHDPQSGYNSLDLSKKIEPPAPKLPPGMGQGPKSDGKPVSEKAPGKPQPGLGATKKAGSTTEAAKDELTLPAFLGNQHTGPLGSLADTQYSIAVMASSVASQATNMATSTGHKRHHERALQAHLRAKELQEIALEDSSTSLLNPVNEEYVKAHETFIKLHEEAIKQLQEKIDSWKGGDEDDQS